MTETAETRLIIVTVDPLRASLNCKSNYSLHQVSQIDIVSNVKNWITANSNT
jgi:hypothetical protein